ncbi:MAG: murein L,D-transpeptidase catalytic domain family protein [Deltaproteobacteria bacterium]|nr:murein L,D-transpeptidase catalytic domain family protein [Deltaproteobacteria bacterium]
MATRLLAGIALLALGCIEGGIDRVDEVGPDDEVETRPELDVCETLICVDELPAAIDGALSGSTPQGFEAYGCDLPGTFLGDETVYRFELDSEGFVAAALSNASDQSSVIVLLDSLDASDCIDGHESAVGALLPAGEYFLAVDTAAGSAPEFSLNVAHTSEAALEAAGLNPQLASDALTVFSNAWSWGATRRTEYTIVDFSLHSADKRQWVFDLSTNELLWNMRVVHGRNSTDGENPAWAVSFSNTPGSHQSSLGLQRAAGTYVGTYGPSFRMEGLEPAFNDRVCSRAIVMHPWAPAGDAYVDRCGFTYPSWGCPAIDDEISLPVRNRLSRPDGASMEYGSLMFYWHPSTDWYNDSVYLHGAEPTAELLLQQTAECDSSYDGTPSPPKESDFACQ